MIFDMIRVPYFTTVKIYSDSPASVPIVWYYANSDALSYPFPNFMLSSLWGTDQGSGPEARPSLPADYYDGRDVFGFNGVTFCGDPNWLVAGIPSTEPPSNPLSCCGMHGISGLVITGEMVLHRGPLLVADGGLVVDGAIALASGPGLPGASGGLVVEGSMSLSTTAFSPALGTGLVVSGEMTLEIDIMSYPITADVWADESLLIFGTLAGPSVDPNQPYGYYNWSNPAAIGNTWNASFFLAAGTYTLYCLVVTGDNRGQVTIEIDGIAQTGVLDAYDASVQYGVELALTVTVIGDGVHVLDMRVSGQNTSSSGYYFLWTKVWFK